MFPASCMCACVCIHNQRWKDGRTDVCVTANPCTFVCVPFKLKWPQKIASCGGSGCPSISVDSIIQWVLPLLLLYCVCTLSFILSRFKCMYRFRRFVDKPNYRGWIKQVNIPLSPRFRTPACTDFFPSSCLHPSCTEAARYSNVLPFTCIGSLWNLLQSSSKEAFMQKHTCFINLNNISGATGFRGSHRCWLRCQEINLSVKIRFKERLHLEEVKRWNLRGEHDEIN